MFMMNTTFVGIAVRGLKKEVPYPVKEVNDKTFVGLPFNSGILASHIEKVLIEEGAVEKDDIIGRFSYLSSTTVG